MNNDELKQNLFAVIADRYKTGFKTQTEFAKAINMPQSNVSRLLRSDSAYFSVSKLIDICLVLGVQVEIKVGKTKIALK